MRPVRLLLVPVLALAALPHARSDDLLFVAEPRTPAGADLPFRPGEVIVQFRDDAPPERVARAVREAGGVEATRSTHPGRYLVRLEAGTPVPQAVAHLKSLSEVDYAEPNGVLRAFLQPSDPLFRLQWHMKMLDAPRTWDIQKGDSSVVVAVLDTGIAFENYGPFRKAPDWGSVRFARGFNAFTRDEHANDDNFHGTHVASTIAEATDNAVGVAGLAYGCALMSVKVLNSEGLGSFLTVAEGVDYAVDYTENGVKVINLSLGGERTSVTLQRSIQRAVSSGIVVVVAAGNENGPVSFPASMPEVISVGAVDARKQRAPYSNFGPELSVVAPGGDLGRDDDGDGRPDGVLQQTFDPDTAELLHRYDDFAYFFVSGTSQATPHVAALAALLVRQGITDPAAVKAAIQQTAEDLGAPGRDDESGFGLIRPAAALTGLGLGH